MSFKNNNLLVICDAYTTFQKDPVDDIANCFNNVYVFVKYNPLVEISKYFPLPALNLFNSINKIDLTNKPSNLDVILTPMYYLPFDQQYKKIGEKQYNIVDQKIRSHSINFNLVHSHFTWPAGYVGMKLKEKYNIPLIITVHGYDIYYLPFKDKNWMERIRSVLSYADYIITVSNSNLEFIKKLEVKSPIIVLPNGFKSDMFYMQELNVCRKTLNLPLNKKIILSIGNLAEVKGHKYLVKAIQEIVTCRKDILCIIIGAGPLEKYLKKQIKDAQLQNYVMILGIKSHNEIPCWINACDLFVLPSLNEGNPTVMFECLGCGKPFIGTKVGGVPEIIISEDLGLLVDPRNSKMLAEKILIGLEKEWDYKLIQEYGKKYEWKNINRDLINLYNLLL